MNTNRLYVLAANDPRGGLFHSKLFMVALIMAILVSLLPAASVFAAPASAANSLKGEWKDKIQNIRAESFFYQRVRVYPADFEDLSELARAHELLNNYGTAYRAAQTLIFNHAGFDANGQVINEIDANKTIKDVADYLHTMRGLRTKLDDLEGKYRLLPLEAITAVTSQ